MGFPCVETVEYAGTSHSYHFMMWRNGTRSAFVGNGYHGGDITVTDSRSWACDCKEGDCMTDASTLRGQWQCGSFYSGTVFDPYGPAFTSPWGSTVRVDTCVESTEAPTLPVSPFLLPSTQTKSLILFEVDTFEVDSGDGQI